MTSPNSREDHPTPGSSGW